MILLSASCPLDRWSIIRGAIHGQENLKDCASSPFLSAPFMLIEVMAVMFPIPLKTAYSSIFGSEMLSQFPSSHQRMASSEAIPLLIFILHAG